MEVSAAAIAASTVFPPRSAISARDDHGYALAIGSPGADRITTALLQVLHRHLLEDIPLQKAIDAPRIHLEYGRDRIQLAHEPDISLPTNSLPIRPFAERSMYFGGVGAARAEGERLEAVADPRRAGGPRIVTHHN